MTLESKLTQDEQDQAVQCTMAMAHATLWNAITASRLRKSAVARRLGVDRANLTHFLRSNISVGSMAKVLLACGYEVRFELVKIQREAPR